MENPGDNSGQAKPGRRALPEWERRVALRVRVKPANAARLAVLAAAAGVSVGQLIDLLTERAAARGGP